MSNAHPAVIVCYAALLLSDSVRAADRAAPLHQRIDHLIAAATSDYQDNASEACSDVAFLRRVYLDLTGRIPSIDDTRSFENDSSDGKRVQIVDRLLQSPEYARHMQHHFDVMLMQRRPKKYVDIADWQEYLYTAFRNNTPWHLTVRDVLSADGVDADKRAASRFLLARDLKPEETTRDLGRIFLGRDLECAQCHDHPNIGDYAQQHYFGISAFLNRSYIFTDPKTKQKFIGEKAVGTVTFTSVFTNEEAETAPQMLDLPPLLDPKPEKDAYVVKPEKTSRGIPRYSRRLQLAKAITEPANRAFRLNIANRLWAMTMGRGLVDPLDMFHTDNPPSHPKLLDLLADDLAANGYNLRRTLREMVLSKTYQRSSRQPQEDLSGVERYYSGLLKPLSPEQLAYSMLRATGEEALARKLIAVNLAKKEPSIVSGTSEYEFRIESALDTELQPHVKAIAIMFASANESSRFDATANQALFVLNGPVIGKWLQPKDGNLISRLLACEGSKQVADELFLTVFSRRPSDAEYAALNALTSGPEEHRTVALIQAVRSTLCSAEFRFNH